MAKYNYTNYSKLNPLLNISQLIKENSFVAKCQLFVRTLLQTSLDAADTAARTISTAVFMLRVSGLHLSGFPKEVQSTLKDL